MFKVRYVCKVLILHIKTRYKPNDKASKPKKIKINKFRMLARLRKVRLGTESARAKVNAMFSSLSTQKRHRESRRKVAKHNRHQERALEA